MKVSEKTETVNSAALISLVLVIIHFLLIFGFSYMGVELSYLTQRTWGYHFIKYFSMPVIIVYYVSFIALILIFLKSSYADAVLKSACDFIERFYVKRKTVSVVFLLVLSFAVLWFFRVKYPLLGDGMLRVGDSVEVKGSYASGLYYYMYLIMNFFTNVSGKTSIELTNTILGVGYFLVSFFLSRFLGKSPEQKIVIFIGIITCGIVLVFFGYVEIYGFGALFLLLYLYLGILYINNKCPLVVVCATLFCAYKMHSLIIVFSPSLLYLLYLKIKKHYPFLINKILLTVVGVCCVLGGLYYFHKTGGGFMLRFFPTERFPNGMLTFRHLIEFINSQILAAPAGLMLGIILTAVMIWKKQQFNQTAVFLGIAGIFGLVFAFTANVLKGSADWDILSFPGIPVTLYSIIILFYMSEKIVSGRMKSYIAFLFVFADEYCSMDCGK